MSGVKVPPASYVPTGSVLHRMRATLKLGLLILFLLASAIFVQSIEAAATCLATVALLYVLARIPFLVAIRQLIGPMIVLIGLALMLWWRSDALTALESFLNLSAAIWAAVLLTLCTRISEMQDALDRILAPLARFGVPVESISLAVSLTIRMIPMFALTVNEVLEAQRARGLRFSPMAFGVPVIVRTLLRARDMGEALVARGVGDDSPKRDD